MGTPVTHPDFNPNTLANDLAVVELVATRVSAAPTRRSRAKGSSAGSSASTTRSRGRASPSTTSARRSTRGVLPELSRLRARRARRSAALVRTRRWPTISASRRLAMRRLLEAVGLPDVEPDAPIRDDDAELLEVAAASASPPVCPRRPCFARCACSRSTSTAWPSTSERCSAPTCRIGLIAAGMPRAQMLEASAEVRQTARGAGFPGFAPDPPAPAGATAVREHGRAVGAAVRRGRGASTDRTTTPEAIVFVDLSGFTRLTEELGDEQAAERQPRARERRAHGRRPHTGAA